MFNGLQTAELWYQLRLHGLDPTVTVEAVHAFFTGHIRLLGVRLHPDLQATARLHPEVKGTAQWAELWMGSEEEVRRCLSLEGFLREYGLTIKYSPSQSFDPYRMSSQTPSTPPTANESELERLLQVERPGLSTTVPPPGMTTFTPIRPLPMSRFRPVDSTRHLPRNLYILGLPLEMGQTHFRSMFTPYGAVEHSILLSQLDGIGRRRGFILMRSHEEAAAAMAGVHAKWFHGFKLDVSWALIQRESRVFPPHNGHGHLPNRVLHPPMGSPHQEPPVECSVIVENLDSAFFPDTAAIKDLFSHFGAISRVTIVPNPDTLQAIIAFEHRDSVRALLKSTGLTLGGSTIRTRPLVNDGPPSPTRPPTPESSPRFDPFGDHLGSPRPKQMNQALTQPRGLLNFNSMMDAIKEGELNPNTQAFVPPIHRLQAHAPQEHQGSQLSVKPFRAPLGTLGPRFSYLKNESPFPPLNPFSPFKAREPSGASSNSGVIGVRDTSGSSSDSATQELSSSHSGSGYNTCAEDGKNRKSCTPELKGFSSVVTGNGSTQSTTDPHKYLRDIWK